MKRIFVIIVLSLSVQFSFGQACGIYRIKYVGKIDFESLKVEKIKLPTTLLLHNLEDENSERSFIEMDVNNNIINTELNSHLTSYLFEKAENLLNYYKTNRKYIPIIIVVIEKGKEKEILIELAWNHIQIAGLEDDGFGNLFELNLNKINIK